MKRFASLCTAALLTIFLAPPAVGAPSIAETSKVIPYVWLGQMTSHAGESKEGFVKRVSSKLAFFTQETGFEGCGWLTNNASKDVWRVRLVTFKSRLGCVLITFEDEGFTTVNESIHSHPQTSSVRPNIQDRRFSNLAFCGGYVRITPKTFSAGDFESGPGYLVAKSTAPFAKTRLVYQSGRENVVEMGPIVARDEQMDRESDLSKSLIARTSSGTSAVAVETLPTECWKPGKR